LSRKKIVKVTGMKAILLLSVSIIFGVLMPIFAIAYSFYTMAVNRKAAPYVPTDGKVLKEILEKVKPRGEVRKKGQYFLELGSGDGRMVRLAVREFGVVGVGVEYNFGLYYWSKLLTALQGLKVKFIKGDLFKVDYSNADIIFAFLLPKSNDRLGEKIKKECKKGTIIISHGFEIREFKRKQFGEIKRELFSTYFYRL
jgi:hypothetical protein